MVALQKLKFVILLECLLIKKKLSNFNISTQQKWTSPIETPQEKGEMTHYLLL